MGSVLLSPRTGEPFTQQIAEGSPFLASPGALVRVPTLVGAFQVNAPAAPQDGASFAVLDVDGAAAASPIVVSGNGADIDGAGSLVLETARELAVLVWAGAEWRRVLPSFAVDGATLEDVFVRYMPPFDAPTNVDAKIAAALATAEADATTKADAAELAAVATASADATTKANAAYTAATFAAALDATTKANAAEAAAVATASADATTKANAAQVAAQNYAAALTPAMGGDVSGTTAAATVAKVNGATVPAAGALTAGNVLKATGASALAYGAVNLAGGAGHVTGILPAANGGTGSASGVTASSIGAARGVALDANHLHAWELTETSGSTFADTGSSAQKVALTIANTANVQLGAAGLFGACPFFGATSAGGNAAAQADALVSAFNDLPAQNWTIEAWACAGSVGTSQINALFSVGDSAAINVQYALNGTTSANMAATVRTTTFLNGSGNANLFNTAGALSNWHHYALVYSGLFALLYVDGELVGRLAGGSTNTQWTNGTTPKLVIGNQTNGGAPLYGRLARVRLSNIVRTQAYLRSVYQQGSLLAA